MAKKKGICSIDACGNPHYGKGFCKKHYQRARSPRGDLHTVRRGRPPGVSCAGGGLTDPAEFLVGLVGTSIEDCIPWPFLRDRDGYGRVQFRGKGWPASRAMCAIAHGDPPAEGLHAAHRCGKGHLGCVNPNHLRWATPKENQRDRIGHGTRVLGEQWRMRKLTEEQVRHIRRLARSLSHEGLAKRFGVSTSTISDINTGKTWKWLK